MAEPTPAEIADALEGICDVLLVRGRSTDLEDDKGAVCIVHALTITLDLGLCRGSDFWHRIDIRRDTLDTIKAHVGEHAAAWNYDVTDDEVFDTLKTIAKHQRELAAA